MSAPRNTQPGFLTRELVVFYLTVVITGASVMMVELLGSRIIGPFYGVSLIVWSSILSVSLLALSLGYSIGGYCADRHRFLTLSGAIFFASLLTSLIPVLSKPVQLLFDPLGLRWGALSSAFVLLSPPLVFLGMAGPFIIRLATTKLDRVGSMAGTVYAVSTVGSVIGTLVLGFYLLPLFGTHSILLAVSLVLLFLAIFWFFYEKQYLEKSSRVPVWAGISLVTLVIVFAQLFDQGEKQYGADTKLVFERETHYGWVRVVDQKETGTRWLMSDGSTIGAEHLDSGQSMLAYQSVVRLLPWFKPDSRDALLIGLGAGHLVADFNQYNVVTDSIEIDPAVAFAAEAYFDLPPSGRVMVGDARYQVQRLDERYDLIVHDCFTGGSEPYHLLSREMMLEIKSKLKPGGILAVNFVGFTDPEKARPVESVARTLDSVFKNRKQYVPRIGETFSDYIFIVSDDDLNPAQHADSASPSAWLADREIEIDASGGLVITDDFNPLEYLQIAKAEYYRNVLIDRVGLSLLFR